MRCVNVDWLEVYAFEDNSRFPMNADYFRERGYFVSEREYGTRVYAEMFTVEDRNGNPFVEVRRAPMSGNSSFTGLSELSCHLRLVNRACYSNSPVRDLAEFMIEHGYIFQRIFRIDVCYDFRVFDSGDDPARFLRRYIENKFSKVNQCRVRVIGDDAWASFDWESVAWGAPSSMVGTKMYNKTKELKATGMKKPWIVQSWFASGLIDDPLNLPDVWRIEFSMHSSARNWIVIEDADAKRSRKRAIPHRLDLFDSRDKLWQRFEELAHHYFQFRHVEYVAQANSESEKKLKRKDVCREKRLFDFNKDREFYKIDGLPRIDYSNDRVNGLLHQLIKYREHHPDMELRKACDIVIDYMERRELSKLTKTGSADEINQIRLAIATRTNWDYQTVLEKAEEIHRLIKDKEIW